MESEIELHRPYLDNLTCKCPRCGGKMKRTPEVIDCWFDSSFIFSGIQLTERLAAIISSLTLVTSINQLEAEALLNNFFESDYYVTAKMSGKELEGLEYEPLRNFP